MFNIVVCERTQHWLALLSRGINSAPQTNNFAACQCVLPDCRDVWQHVFVNDLVSLAAFGKLEFCATIHRSG